MSRFLGCKIFSKENWGEILKGMYDLHFNCLGFAYIDFKFYKNLLCWNSFQKLPENGEAICLFSYIERFPAFLYEFYHFPQIY